MKNLSLTKITHFIIIVFFVLSGFILSINTVEAQGGPGASCSGNTCNPGLVCINNYCSSPRGNKTEGQSCSGNDCIAGLECRDFICKKEGAITGTSGTPGITGTSGTPGIQGTSGISGSPGGSTGSETGLVKCGVSRDCTICDIFILVRDIFNFALGLLAALSVLSIVIGGFYVVTSAGNSGRVSEGYSIITNAVIGLLLVMASFLLFSFVLVALGFQSANFSAIFDFQDGQIFSVKCDNASAFNDRGTGGGGVPTTPSGRTGPVTCKNSECLAKNPQLKAQIEKSAAKYGIESNILLAIIDEGEGCNPSVTAACSRSYNDADCSAGYTQCTPDIRAKFTGISDPKASLDKILSSLETDIDCGAWLIGQNAGICPLSDVRRVAACYNDGPSGGCGTRNYCERVLKYYEGC